MSSADRFDRYLHSLLEDLAGDAAPGYLDDALARATATPQLRGSRVWRVLGGVEPSRPAALRAAVMGAVIVVALAIVGLGILVFGPAPAPTPTGLSTQGATSLPSSTTSATLTPAPSPSAAAVAPCPGYADAADARVSTKAGDIAWQAEAGPLPEGTAPGEGRIAAYALDLQSGRPAVVLIEPTSDASCRLIDLDADEEVFQFGWSSGGDALAVSTGRRLLVWSRAGLAQAYRVGAGETTDIGFAWSPLNEVIAIEEFGQRPLLVFADGSRHRLPLDSAGGLAWSPDGSLLAATGMLPSDAAAGRRVVLITRAGEHISVVPSAAAVTGWVDSATLIAPRTGPGSGISAYDVTSHTWRSWSESWTGDLGLVNEIGFAPGLTGVALFNDGGLLVIDLPSVQRHVLATGLFPPLNAAGFGAWSPDGKRLAIAVEAVPVRPGLWIYDRAGGEPTHISDLHLRLAPGAWQPAP